MSSNSKLPLQAALFLSANKTLKDVKTEILLSFALKLFDEYQQLKDVDDYRFLEVKICERNDLAVDLSISNLIGFLQENVLKKETLFKIFKDANLSKQNLLLAKQYEPQGIYFEKLSMLLKSYIPNGGLFMPEYLGLLLMYYYQIDSKQIFARFPYIEEFDFSHILSIYEEANINVKKDLIEKHPNTRLWEHRTVFDEMDKIAKKIIKEYHLFKYKLNINRVSKTRKKK